MARVFWTFGFWICFVFRASDFVFPSFTHRTDEPPIAGADMPVLETCSPVSTAVSPCPGCRNPLHLTSRLHGRLVRCRSCRGVLAVVAVSGQRHTAEDPAAHESPHPMRPHLARTARVRSISRRSCTGVLSSAVRAARSWPSSGSRSTRSRLRIWQTPRTQLGTPHGIRPGLRLRPLRLRNGKRRAGPPTQPPLSAALSQPAPPADSESVRPPETRVVAAEEDGTEAGREPDSLSEPEVLSDEEASDFLADLDSPKKRAPPPRARRLADPHGIAGRRWRGVRQFEHRSRPSAGQRQGRAAGSRKQRAQRPPPPTADPRRRRCGGTSAVAAAVRRQVEEG